MSLFSDFIAETANLVQEAQSIKNEVSESLTANASTIQTTLEDTKTEIQAAATDVKQLVEDTTRLPE
jgi:gas vesicle protein